jgi:holo-[acyl-carrier protein] synthase
MSILVGIDMQPIDEVESSIKEFGARYTHRLFTDDEIASCGDGPGAASGFAGRFAAKEAVLKILELNEIVPRWKSIEVLRSMGGRPEVALHGEAAKLARSQGIEEISLSIGLGGGMASATVIAQVTQGRIGARKWAT